jgi:hypothetical protein
VNTAFSRWGDGEWDCIMCRGLMNCDGNQYFYDLSERLRNILENPVTAGLPNYQFGIQEKAWCMYKFEISEYLSCKGIEKTWVDSDIFHKMSEAGEFLDWLKKIDKPIGLVAPDRIAISFPAKVDRCHAIPLRDAWLYYEKDELLKTFAGFEGVIFFCCGMAANVMIDDLFFSETGGKCCLIDAGSVFDPYCGFETRRYHKNVRRG